MIALDTNILVYAHRRESRHHDFARDLLQRFAEGPAPWAIPWPCCYEFFAVVTHVRIWKDAATRPEQACSQLEAWQASPSLKLLAESEDMMPLLADLLRRPQVRGGIVHDARVAALCLAHGVERLLTADRNFRLFPELRTENPFPVA